jgi:hypothetical protein
MFNVGDKVKVSSDLCCNFPKCDCKGREGRITEYEEPLDKEASDVYTVIFFSPVFCSLISGESYARKTCYLIEDEMELVS